MGHKSCLKLKAMVRAPDRADDIALLLRAWFGSFAGISARVIEGVCPLFPEEEVLISAAVPKRREEFSAGRWCARKALLDLGVPAAPILIGRRHEPLWPPGIVGTITHAANLSAAVVGRVESWRGMGIDILDATAAEPILREAGSVIAAEDEQRTARLVAPAGVDPRALLFGAKESVIKAISESLQRFVEFTEIRVALEDGHFQASCAELEVPVRGWWNATDGLILTGAVLHC